MVQSPQQLEQLPSYTVQDFVCQKDDKFYKAVNHQYFPIHPVNCCLVQALTPIVVHFM